MSSPLSVANFLAAGTYALDPLLSDGANILSCRGTIASGSGVFKRGTIVHLDPTTGAITPGDSSPNAVIGENADATLTPALCLVYLTGKMKADAIIWPGTGGRGAVAEQLRDVGIVIESVILPVGHTSAMLVPVTINPTNRSHTANAGGASFAVTIDAGRAGAWFATQEAAATWLKITAPDTPQSVDGSVFYTITAQVPAAAARTGHIYINNQTFTVNQAAG